jgi:hypothetical protein
MPNVTMYTTQGMETTTDNRWNPNTGGLSTGNANDIAAMSDIASLDTLLATLDGVYWTSRRLNQESIWDKLFYLRTSRRGTASLT